MFKTYILILQLKRDLSINIGCFGLINFKKGYYIYTGSARRNVNLRVERHLKKEKKLHWHIDYLTNNKSFEIKLVYLIENYEECEISKIFYQNNFIFIERFGSSDCKCKSHLFHSKNLKEIKTLLKSVKKRRFL